MNSHPGLPASAKPEQIRAVATLCISLALIALLSTMSPWVSLLPSLGASAILLAILPNSPTARLGALFGGTLLCGVIAILIGFVHLPLWLSVPLAAGLALFAMYHLRCLHPPAGALLLWFLTFGNTLDQPFLALLYVVPGLLLIALCTHLGLVLSSGRAGTSRSDVARNPTPSLRHGPTAEDWQQALAKHKKMLDIDGSQLYTLYRELLPSQIAQRLSSTTVEQIMSRDVISLDPADTAQKAWRTLQDHHIKTIPVVSDGQVVGTVALVDMLKHFGLAWRTLPEDLASRAQFILTLDVASLMSKPAYTVRADLPLDALMPLLSDWGVRRVPVVDDAGHLVGMVTQSDLVAALAHLLSVSPLTAAE
jgi:CBS domain-containing membrane protein